MFINSTIADLCVPFVKRIMKIIDDSSILGHAILGNAIL